jgi:hypothetical protein
MVATVNANTTTGVVVTSDTSGSLALQTGGTTALTISSAQVATFANAPVMSGSSITGQLTATNMPSGAVVQVVYGTSSTSTTTTSTTYATTNLSGSITPQFSSSKILVLISQQMFLEGTVSFNGFEVNVGVQLYRDATNITTSNSDSSGCYSFRIGQASAVVNQQLLKIGKYVLNVLDSPATTSSTTYSTKFRVGLAGMSATAQVGNNYDLSTIVLMEIRQ